ncbi:MAG: formate dehydrogenase accessory sulfurtransferase FdhD [Bacteroidota bacterium]|jgi:FdhD protein
MAYQVVHKKITRLKDNSVSNVNDLLAVEEPMQIKLLYWQGDIPVETNISITMRTPGNDFELSVGFLFTEGVITNPDFIESVSYCNKALSEGKENVVKVMLKKNAPVQLPQAERNFYISGSCGVCGKTAIESLEQTACFPIDFDFSVNHEQLFQLKNQMQQEQVNFKYTGGIHACALFDETGNIMIMREDIGRHNALDKLIGHYTLQQALPLEKKILLLSGRISFELVQKAVMAGIPIICGVGAPSSLAVETAERSGVTLIGFLKETSLNIYTHSQRVRL